MLISWGVFRGDCACPPFLDVQYLDILSEICLKIVVAGQARHSAVQHADIPPPQSANQCVRMYVQVYTEWANHYLAKAGQTRRITNLQNDLRDGLLLSAIVQTISK